MCLFLFFMKEFHKAGKSLRVLIPRRMYVATRVLSHEMQTTAPAVGVE